jgi:hypothetical protein
MQIPTLTTLNLKKNSVCTHNNKKLMFKINGNVLKHKMDSDRGNNGN